ncbi:hypothetical protein [Caldalkalibacillus salinus]|uniref:hypothetical protein n=1 Tax=Caldalkalibacillus salinus TaxID=2803787 RepID=UPI0019250B5C|nr:hypothetical protein [Caldalkalibacillus salinus]
MHVEKDSFIKLKAPQLNVGVIQYHDTQVLQTPKMLQGRFQFFHESLRLDFEEEGCIQKHPQLQYVHAYLEALGIDVGYHVPVFEEQFHHILSGHSPTTGYSALDITHFFSLRYFTPILVLDVQSISGDILTLRMGEKDETIKYNGKEYSVEQLLVFSDAKGAVASPFLPVIREALTYDSHQLVQLIFMPQIAKSKEDGQALLQTIIDLFLHVHGGGVQDIQIV